MWYKHSIIVFLTVLNAVNCDKFKVIREWNYLNFTWPIGDEYRTAIAKGLYVPENNIIGGIKYFDDSFYVTLPRMRNGVPATLAKIPGGIVVDTAPLLEPFPSWEMNVLGDCNALQNVQNVEIDSKGQMWIIDNGRTETLSTTPTARCPPKLIIFDIKRNRTTTAYTFPDSVASFNSNYLYDIVVDETDGGYAYITDNSAQNPGIIVFSVKDHHSWKIYHPQTMKADSAASTFRVGPTVLQAPINLASIALGPKVSNVNGRTIINADRQVYYCPLSSLHLYALSTSVLRNEENGLKNGEYQGEVGDLGMKASQTVGMIMDNNGTLFYSLLATNSIAKWNVQLPFQSSQQVIARDVNFLEWPNSFTFDQSGNITVLVNRLNRFIYDKLDLNQANFRLITSRIGTKSYLYDQTYDINTMINGEGTTTTPIVPVNITTTPDISVPEIYRTSSVPDRHPAPNPISDQSNPEPTAEPEPEPKPEPEPTPEPSAEPEPTPEPEPTSQHDQMKHDYMDHEHIDQNHMNHNHMPQGQQGTSTAKPSASEEPKSGSSKLLATFLGVLTASMLFLV